MTEEILKLNEKYQQKMNSTDIYDVKQKQKCKQAKNEWLNEKYAEIETLWHIDVVGMHKIKKK